MLGDLFYRLGEAIGTLEARGAGSGAGGFGAGFGTGYRAGAGPDDAPEAGAAAASEGGGAAGAGSVAAAAVASTAVAWLASRLLRPKPVSWPRVILAGAGAALLADLVGRTEDDAPPGELSYAADPAELLGRLSAGIAVAAGYASILYPRIPGPPLFRGLAFGALEIAAAPRGGLVRMAAEAPGLRFPLQTLALPVDEDASPLAHLAFGLALGILYRNGRGGDEEPDVEEDDEGVEDED